MSNFKKVTLFVSGFFGLVNLAMILVVVLHALANNKRIDIGLDWPLVIPLGICIAIFTWGYFVLDE